MRNVYRSLLLILVGATQKELARHLRYLMVENQLLRSKLPYRVPITDQERNRSVRFGSKLGRRSTIWCRLSTQIPCGAGFERIAAGSEGRQCLGAGVALPNKFAG